MADRADITIGTIETEVTSNRVVLKHSVRSGNDEESISISDAEFGTLFTAVQAIAQLKPEWV